MAPETVDQSSGFRQFAESFDQRAAHVSDCRPKQRPSSVWLKFSPAFFKRRRGRGRGALVAVRRRRNIPFGVSFGQILQSRFAAEQREAFTSFSAPSSCREKVAMAFVHFLFQLPFVDNLRGRQSVVSPGKKFPSRRFIGIGHTLANPFVFFGQAIDLSLQNWYNENKVDT